MCDLSVALSLQAIKRNSSPRMRVVEYRDIKKYRDIDELLSPLGACVVLYTNNFGERDGKKFKFGHWVLLHVVHPKCIHGEGVIEFFDSYGAVLDSQFNFMDESFVRGYYDYTRRLSNYIGEGGYRLIYNKTQFQELERGINTCGKHVCFRFQNRHLKLHDYTQHLLRDCQQLGITPDEFVCWQIDKS